MLADEGAEVALPNLLAVVIERGQQIMIGFVPNDINALAIDCGRGRSVAVEWVAREWSQRKIPAPEQATVVGAQAEHGEAP